MNKAKVILIAVFLTKSILCLPSGSPKLNNNPKPYTHTEFNEQSHYTADDDVFNYKVALILAKKNELRQIEERNRQTQEETHQIEKEIAQMQKARQIEEKEFARIEKAKLKKIQEAHQAARTKKASLQTKTSKKTCCPCTVS